VPPSFKKVFIIVLENTAAVTALQQPYLQSLRQTGAYLNQFFAVTHPSQPNYIALTSGSTNGVSGDGNVTLAVKHVGDLLDAKHLTWRVYAEGFPGPCFLGARSGTYVRKHAPFLSYQNVQRNAARCANIVNAAQLDQDIAAGTLADYSLYIPDLKNDGHDTGVSFADMWLRQAFEPKFTDPRFTYDMLVVVTFDEDDQGHGNHIYTVLLGESVLPGTTSETRYDFFNLLRTIEETFALGTLGKHDAKAAPITGVWKGPTPDSPGHAGSNATSVSCYGETPPACHVRALSTLIHILGQCVCVVQGAQITI
jgi:hypothetical protein